MASGAKWEQMLYAAPLTPNVQALLVYGGHWLGECGAAEVEIERYVDAALRELHALNEDSIERKAVR